MQRFYKALLIFSLIVASPLAQADTYIVKKGDTLASVARTYYGEPVFGPRGTINKIYRLNSWAKAAGSTLEPGQKITLEGNLAATSEKVAVEPIPEPEAFIPAPPIVQPPPAPTPQPPAVSAVLSLPPEEHAERVEAHHETLPKPLPREEHHYEPVEPHEHSRNYFSIIPSYSLVNQKAFDAASGNGYSLYANSFGAELGWDHWWSESFSTIFTYNISQISSQATSDLTGAKILDATTIREVELSLLNKVGPLRLGLGAAYGDHLFLETVGNIPVDPTIYKTAFWNPFFMAELTAFESERFEWLLNVKVSALPAQVGKGHDLTSGTELFGEISLLQKFEHWALTYGVSYSTEDQTRTDASETRTETAVKFGVLF